MTAPPPPRDAPRDDARLALSVQYASARPAPPRDRIRRWVRATLRAIDVPAARLNVRFVDEDEGRDLNRRFRGRDYATNVLTFPYAAATSGPDVVVEADIVICVPVVEAEAAAQGKTADVHGAHLVVHGTLHACGRDHEDEDDAEAMEAVERAVLAGFRIVDPYRIDETVPP